MRGVDDHARAALDLLFPRRCCSCLQSIEGEGESGLCWDCRVSAIPLEQPFCACCGSMIPGRVDHAFRCLACDSMPPHFDRARSLFRYEGGIRDAIHALKYHRNLCVVPDLAALLRAGIQTHFPSLGVDSCVVPVPLHPRRQRKRGFNQSELLAQAIRELPARSLLRRVRNTGTQTHLTAAQRHSNVRGAFALVRRPGPLPETVLLLDDVMTTGATLDAAARTLRAAGIRRVCALTLARG